MNLREAVEQKLAQNAVRPAEVSVHLPDLDVRIIVRKVPRRLTEKAIYHYRDSEDVEVDMVAGLIRWALYDENTGQLALDSYESAEKLIDILTDGDTEILRSAMKQLGEEVADTGGVEAGKAS